MKQTWNRAIIISSTLTLLLACTAEQQASDLHVVLPGKADNYYSNMATEYEMTGQIQVAMTAEEYADEMVRAGKITGRLTAAGLYLTTYLTDKFRGIDINGDGEITEDEVFFHNEEYGGFHAMVRNQSLETESLGDLEEGGLWVNFTVDVAGPPGLLESLPGSWDGDARVFDVRMPAGKAVSPDWVPRSEIRNFDPTEYEGELENTTYAGRVLPEPANAWPQYAAFVADGVFDITLFYGHDYNAARSDLKGAEDAFDELGSLGFTRPVEAFSELAADSGPAVKMVKVRDRQVEIQVRIFHSDMFIDARPEQRALALSELATRDVFFYNGHAGPYYGFYLDADGLAGVNYLTLRDLGLPADRQQLFIAQGCQTYSQYADMLYANPAKSEANLDVITTVNYSYGRGTMTVLRNLVRTDAGGYLNPADSYKLVADLNGDWINSYYDVFYGVMGIDGNPQMHPFAEIEKLGLACTAASECGHPGAYVCLDPGDGMQQCAGTTLGENACPSGTRYLQLAEGNTLVGGACFKESEPEPELVHGIAVGSAEALAVRDLVNRASQRFLDDVVKLDKRAAANIVEHRLGLDGIAHTDDDDPVDDLYELDSISWVSKRAFGKLQAYLATQPEAREQFAADLKAFLVEYYAEYGDDIVSSGGNTLELAQQAVDARDVFEVVSEASDPFGHDLVETRVMGHPDVTFPRSDTVFYGAYTRADETLLEVYDFN